ncbi:AfsR/SARP family transcriptional regulator [Amycolatopsis anabasis]|uniref:AfsR/SARP family transcriptional regulator n=1 Tax=Amycolatopsis anabasis TaxID=1840409 RepID=UPI001C555E38|nr:AfsR/SARP family transcriptional regulator [Amycolatopsis anabasis]
MSQMIFRVLGPLSVEDRGCCRTPTAAKQRQVLVLLLLKANSVVPLPQFVEELWEGTPPARAIAALHTYVMQLRKALEQLRLPDGSGGRLLTRKGGYELVVKPGELDLDVFEHRVRAALAVRDTALRAHGLREALRLWSAPALVDVVAGPILRAAITLLQRKQLDAISHRIEADLELGRHHELIGELTALVHHHRTHEEFTAQLMLALYRSGRQVDALAAFHRLRKAVAEDSGGALSRRLHELYTNILSADATLDPPSSTRSRLSLDMVVPMAV